MKNIKYIYQLAFLFNKKLKYTIPSQIMLSILIPIIATIIPSIAIGFITEGYGIKYFLIVIGVVSLVYGFMLFTNQYLSRRNEFENIFVRIKEFYLAMSAKLMTTDYVNVEPQAKQIDIQKAIMSFSSNWVGIELMLKNTPVLIINFVGLIIYSVLISSLNYLIIIILIVMSILNYLLNMYAQKYEEKHKKDYAKVDRQINYLYESSTSLINGKDVRIYKMEDWFYKIFHGLIKKRVNWSRKIEYRYFLPFVSDSLLLLIRDIIAYIILINLVLDKSISITTFTLYVGIISGFSTWLNSAVTAFSNLKRANLGVNDFRHYMEIDEVFNHKEGSKLPETFPLEIEFKNVSFRYPGAESDTLTQLSFKIKKGSKVALVGNNGAGKTTIVKLITGMYYPTVGEILVSGKRIEDYNIDEYYSLIGAVFQDVEVLAFNIAKNVSVTKEANIDYDKLYQSLELAGLKDKVLSLKNKDKTNLTQYIDKDGILLSGGEMQKLMLARSLYKDAPIMILDEPTAALDPIAESELYEKYNDLTKDKTSLFISHRLSSTKFCDRILFLENGQIIEDGTHHELMTLNGKYANMFEIQSHYYKEDLKEDRHE
jgi:ABC-type multidrug transport system fused ATPase/permease subunit